MVNYLQMEKLSFNEDWKIRRLGSSEEPKSISVPYDAMITEERGQTSKGGKNIGFFMGYDYEYTKTFLVPEEDREKDLFLEFEAVYHEATVYVNGIKAAFHENGYIGFTVPLNGLVRYGEENEIKVVALNSDQPNSRWYSGTGIIRPVSLLVCPKRRIVPSSLRIETLGIAPAKIRITLSVTASGTLSYSLQDPSGKTVLSRSLPAEKDFTAEETVPEAKLWSAKTPDLYVLSLDFEGDKEEETFGIRTLSLSQEKGLLINGEPTVLYGACLHHDNGLIGAVDDESFSFLKIRSLKDLGFNAIRCAHNPVAKSILKACDILGMYVMDEYVDCWITHKTQYDYVRVLKTAYPEDLKALAEKDFNHPSVIFYSLGNEVGESSKPEGIEIFKAMRDTLRSYDSTRYITCGINIFFNWLYAHGLGVYSDKKSAEEAKTNGKKKKSVGSEFFNELAGHLGAGFMKTMATMSGCDRKTKKIFAEMDAAGYNYGIKRYGHDFRKYPDRFILGSETFCHDLRAFLRLSGRYPRLLGDFIWAGIDYLGECGVGAMVYDDYCPAKQGDPGWMGAGSGRLDITLRENGECEYVKAMLGKEPIGLAAEPVCFRRHHHSPSAWKMTNAEPSWSYRGEEGKKTLVEAYTLSPRVALYLNGKLLGQKKTDKNGMAFFKVRYQDGTLKAVALDQDKKEVGEKTLLTGEEKTVLTFKAVQDMVRTSDLLFLRIRLSDPSGIIKANLRDRITILSAENATLLGFGSGNPYCREGYQNAFADTYYGECLAIFRPTGKGPIRITAESPKYGKAVYEGKAE